MGERARVRVVVPDDYNDVYASAPAIARLRERADVTIHTTMPHSLDAWVERLAGAAIAVANRERIPLGAPLFERLPRLEMIAQTAGGGSHLDLAAATERGILVTGTKGASASTAELTVALMLAAMRRIPYGDAELRAGRWSQFVGRELAGKRLGVVGLGRIGGQVARVCAAMGMDVRGWSPSLTAERAAAVGAEYQDLDALLAESDVVTVHMRLTPASRGTLNRKRLALLKPSALFVNTARAALIDEGALVEMLKDGRLWGAALDVYSEEPLPPNHPLLALPNAVLTPHIGWVAEESYRVFIEGVVENILAYLDGRPVPFPLNPNALQNRPPRP
ncbi:MAG TPA: D-2-hydroxyacid dehydrogenase family protein [Thermomicrobiales bacterium]